MGVFYVFINTLSHNLGTLTSWNPLGHSKPVMGLFYLSINTLSHNLETLTSWNRLGHSRPVTGLLYLFMNVLWHNLWTLTSWNPLGLSRPVMGLLYLYIKRYGMTCFMYLFCVFIFSFKKRAALPYPFISQTSSFDAGPVHVGLLVYECDSKITSDCSVKINALSLRQSAHSLVTISAFYRWTPTLKHFRCVV